MSPSAADVPDHNHHKTLGDSVRQRRCRIIELCRTAPRLRDELQHELAVSRNTLGGDIGWLRQHFPHCFRQIRGADGCRRLHWQGPPPIPIATPPDWLTEEELLALVAARGLLRDPRGGPAENSQAAYQGLLDGALDGLLHRLGLQEAVADIAPDTMQVSRFAARHEDPATLDEVSRALLRFRYLRFDYLNNRNESHPVHAAPLRLVNIAGEWHLFAWAAHADDATGGRMKQYRISRMTCAAGCRDAPPRLPPHISQRQVDERLDEAFRATGSTDPADRRRVVLAVSPRGLPHLIDRRWGGDQRWDPAGDFPPLPPGWRRLAFTTTGLAECRHWVLSLGTAVRAERPAELVAWLRAEAVAVAASLTDNSAANRTTEAEEAKDRSDDRQPTTHRTSRAPYEADTTDVENSPAHAQAPLGMEAIE